MIRDDATRGGWQALLAFSLLSCADASVRSVRGSVSVFQIGLTITLFGLAAALATKPRGQDWAQALTIQRPAAVLARAVAGTGSAAAGVYAFTHLPLPQAYGLIFLAPFLTTLLARVALREPVRPRAWAAIAVGFAGVLLVVRPGLSPLGLGHAAALATAVCTAAGVVILRSMAGREERTAVLSVQMGMAALFNGVALIATGGARFVGAGEAIRLGGAAAFAFAGQLCLLIAASRAPTERVAPMHYVQLAWAVLFSTLLFHEAPDAPTLVGLAVIAGAGLLSVRA